MRWRGWRSRENDDVLSFVQEERAIKERHTLSFLQEEKVNNERHEE